jgi:hypothetical protein
MNSPAPGLRFPLLAAVALAGCAGDTSLRPAPPSTDEVSASGDGPQGLGDGAESPTGAGGTSSPWANLDPGELPDTVFAVAWVDLTEGCVNCYYAANSPDRYDIIDPLGQVLSSFELPFDWEDESYYPPALRSLEPLGPGRFLAANTLQGSTEYQQVVWEGDAYTGEARVLARIFSRRVELPQTGELLLFADELWPWDVQVLPDPDRDGALLLVPTMSSPYLSTVLREVLSVPYDDAEAEVRRWPVTAFAPHLLPEEWPMIEPAGLARLADDGSGRLVLGLRGWQTDADGAMTPTSELASFFPSPEIEAWSDPIPEALLRPTARVVPGDGESSPIVLAPPGDCSGPFTWWEDGVATELPLPQGDMCPTLGPLLDLPSHTFVYSAWTSEQEYPDAHRVVVMAHGEELWSIDRFRRGLSERPFHLLGATALMR